MSDGLIVEFNHCFLELIKDPLLLRYKECIDRKEMTTTIKQGLIILIPKPNEDNLRIKNWRPISLLNIDFKILVQVYAKLLNMNLKEIISRNQNGFMAKHHTSLNIRLVSDLSDYSNCINSDALLVFLNIYKAFHSIKHSSLYRNYKFLVSETNL